MKFHIFVVETYQMQKYILRLILDDIKITRLLNSMQDIDISVQKFYLGNVHVILWLLDLAAEQSNIETYNCLIEEIDDEMFASDDKLKQYSFDILKRLQGLVNSKIN